MDFEFSGKTAIASGAASGMGFVFSKSFAAAGGNVVMCDINQDALSACVDEVNAGGKGRAIGVLCDVRDYAQVTAACGKAVEVFGSLDIVVNFAGGTATRMLGADHRDTEEFPDVDIRVYDWGIDVNLKGQFYFCHAAAKIMREQESGLIINIGSVTGVDGDGYGVDYPTAKAGVMYGLTKSVAQFGGKHNIRCVCVAPGPALTRPGMAHMKTLLGRAAEPQELVDFILFLASPEGEFINGETILMDGGRAAMPRG